MIRKFIEKARSVETVVKVIPKLPGAINETLHTIIKDDKKIVISDFKFVNDELLREFKKNNSNIIVNPPDEELAKAKYGITDSFAGIAETASVCLLNDNSMTGSFSLFTEVHIAFLNAEDIVPRPRNIFLDEPFKSITEKEDFIIVSGSSATADMGTLVRGVHGPAKLYVVILN